DGAAAAEQEGRSESGENGKEFCFHDRSDAPEIFPVARKNFIFASAPWNDLSRGIVSARLGPLIPANPRVKRAEALFTGARAASAVRSIRPKSSSSSSPRSRASGSTTNR